MGELPDPGLPRSWLDLVLRTDGHRTDHRAEDRKESGHAGRERGTRIIPADRGRSVLQKSRGAPIQGPCELRTGVQQESDTVGCRTPMQQQAIAAERESELPGLK